MPAILVHVMCVCVCVCARARVVSPTNMDPDGIGKQGLATFSCRGRPEDSIKVCPLYVTGSVMDAVALPDPLNLGCRV